MIHGLSDYEKFKVIRPVLGNHAYDQKTHMPIMNKVTTDMLDIHRAKPLNIQNLSTKHDNSDKIVFSFRYDKDIKRYWDDPMKYIPTLQTAMAVATPDFSAYPSMNPNEIRHNIYKSRWLGCLWQDYGCLAIPTIAWALPDTYDICFGGVEYGSVVVISTVGCEEHLNEFFNGYEEMMTRINPELIIVYGRMIPGMYGRFLHYNYSDVFNTGDASCRQMTLFDFYPIFEIQKGVYYGK